MVYCFFLLDNTDQNQRLSLIQELETLRKVGRHSNIVSLVGVCAFEGTCNMTQITYCSVSSSFCLFYVERRRYFSTNYFCGKILQ